MRGLALCKPGLAALASAAAAAGYLIAAPRASWTVLAAAAGVFFLAAGAGALNEYQERGIDRLMDRTRGRPIPAGLVRPELALAVAAALIGTGLAILSRGGVRPVALGALAVAWYNGIYTPLKRSAAMAAVPGALSGALAPAVGAAFAGARLDNPRVAGLALLLFIWQIPHFWLIVLDRVREFRAAGLPNLLDVLPESRARRVVAHWVLATAASSLAAAGWGSFGSPVARGAVLALSLWLAARALRFRTSPFRLERTLFRAMNIYMAALLLAISLDRLLI
jgi:protoheme IX farnesyltransferase